MAAATLVLLAFLAGYATYPLLHQGPNGIPAPLQLNPAGDDLADMRSFWQVWNLLDRDFYGDTPPATARTYGAIAGLAQSYGDPYTFFVEPHTRELERDELAGRFGGIGATLEATEAGYIVHPQPDQPAAQAGVRDGDLLLQIDDHPITPQRTYDEVVALIRGQVGSVVTLLVQRGATAGDAGEALSIPVTRAEIQTPSIEWRLLDSSPQNADIGYIRQTVFSERSPQEMRQALEELAKAGAHRYIWDLRGNPGGLVNSAVEQVDMWLDDGTILVEEKVGGIRKTFEATPGTVAANVPLIVVVDGGSASASEIVAGALRDNDRARLVGTKTFGKGSVQLIHELPDQSSLHVTTAEWFTPGGTQISGQGLEPDISVVDGVDPLAAAVDALPLVQEAKKR
jgi:carboxyl-terminal processing protease